MPYSRRGCCALSAAVAGLLYAGSSYAGSVQNAQPGVEAKKPSLSLKITPPVGFAPLKTRLVVDVRNGDDDFADFYCPTIEWDWGDDTRSESTVDCPPYEEGKSQIRRRFTVEHTFKRPGVYRVFFRLKRRDRAVATATTNITVRPGARDYEP